METIKRARNKRGWTQEQLANAVGVKRSVISKYENGTISPSADMLHKIAHALYVDIYDLIDGGFGALDAVLPPNWQGVNLDHAKVDSKFMSILLANLIKLDRNSAVYIRSRNAIYALADSSGLSSMVSDFIAEHEKLSDQATIYFSNSQKMMEAFNRLNLLGQQEAVKRIEELTEIPRYRRQAAPEPPAEDAPEPDTPPPPEGAEGPQKPTEG